jgi:HEAT repeat protein
MDALAQASRDENDWVRLAVVRALAERSASAEVALPVYVRALDDEKMIFIAALKGLIRLGRAAEPAIPRLIRKTDLPDPMLRIVVASTLDALGPPTARRAGELAEILADTEASDLAREITCRYLAMLGHEGHAGAASLIALLRAPSADLRRESAAALEKILVASDPEIELLEALLADEDEDVRTIAGRVLERVREPR